MMRLRILFFVCLFFAAGMSAQKAFAASLVLSPNSGTFEVGSTFGVSVFLDSENQPVNTVDIELKFPPDALQIVAPTTGKSIISTWIDQPFYDNERGIVRFRGGMPGGITTSRGLITVLTFKTRKPGTGIIRFTENSQVLANDGKATNVLFNTQNSVYQITLPPPLGPVVASETFPDQTRFFGRKTAIFTWANDFPVDGYSYILSENPVEIPDNISEGAKQSVSYTDLASGVYYFHLKSLRGGVWGGVTHFAINADSDPPAAFSIDVEPDTVTSSHSIIAYWFTTDAVSGIDLYEYQLIQRDGGTFAQEAHGEEQSIFIVADSPQVFTIDEGSYTLIVRAYDKAGNFREETVSILITTPFQLALRSVWTWVMVMVFIALLSFIAYKAYLWHRRTDALHTAKILPDHVQHDLAELKKYQSKYGKIALFVCAFGIAAFGIGVSGAYAQSSITPPLITTVSRGISNEEIFYIGGKTDNADVSVLLYLQNIQSGETRNFEVVSDKKGNWFYRHNSFLAPGSYIVWAQTNIGDVFSPPTPQIQLDVRRTAFQFGTSRLSYETLYLLLFLFLLAMNAGLVLFIAFHIRHGRRKRNAWLREVHEAEQSLKRGFAVLKRDIERELDIVHEAKKEQALSTEEQRQEKQLISDLAWAENYIGKEIWDIEKEVK